MIKKVEKIELVCPVCEKVFYKNLSDIKNVKGKPCCSLECSRISRQKYKELGISVSKDRLHHIWYKMIERCNNKNCQNYKYYGARNITVCNEWKNNFLIFREWAINNGYKENLSIERIDVNGNYEPSNCTWITMENQLKNKQNTLKINYKGNIKRLKDIALLENIDYKDLWINYKKLNNIDEAIKICKIHNQGLMITNKSGFRGVRFNKNAWQVSYKHKYIGRYKTFEEAVNKRLELEHNEAK